MGSNIKQKPTPVKKKKPAWDQREISAKKTRQDFKALHWFCHTKVTMSWGIAPSILCLDTTTTTVSSSVINWHWNCLCCLPSHEGLRGWHASQHITHSNTRCQHLRARTRLTVRVSELSPYTLPALAVDQAQSCLWWTARPEGLIWAGSLAGGKSPTCFISCLWNHQTLQRPFKRLIRDNQIVTFIQIS